MKPVQIIFLAAVVSGILLSCGEENVLVPTVTPDSSANNFTRIMGDWNLKSMTTINYGYDRLGGSWRGTTEILYGAASDYHTSTTDKEGNTTFSNGVKQKIIVRFLKTPTGLVVSENFPNNSSGNVSVQGNFLDVTGGYQSLRFKIVVLTDKRLVLTHYQANGGNQFTETTYVMLKPDGVLPSPTNPG